ncbi:uncharacterized protein CTHT_0035150 [Thermochaetoides thermophila DSM 1495]|uniref:Cell wall protein n=1 Tax=Chaetomium thermophilum (strain DSM 1495 / CBS 144.50 / IMI 039719) TaxID=759272 RepID=G0S6P8_CHATD|nr:hypothetical protein CTHT_0035150 [Thermochaetoides thermophila DSM 1495]EGS21650.1 hypothetical protein CTHT_0035150 [Thermochaetoides thermophila DSM 1495]
MRAALLSLGALALPLVAATEVDVCDAETNLCLSGLLERDDPAWLCEEVTPENVIGQEMVPSCATAQDVVSACECILYDSDFCEEEPEPTTTAGGSDPEPTTTDDTEEPPATTVTVGPTGGSGPETTAPPETTMWTTSTITTTRTYTITSCPPEITRCPGGGVPIVTSEVIITTTVCPVTDGPEPTFVPPPAQPSYGNHTLPSIEPSKQPENPAVPPAETGSAGPQVPPPAETKSFGTITVPTAKPPTPTGAIPEPPIVTAGAGRVVAGFSVAIAVAGVFAALF